MEFLDEDARPRFVLESKSTPQTTTTSSLHKPTLLICISLSVVLLTLSLFTFNFEPLQSLLIWASLSLLLGPFAPPSLTAGDVTVGLGPPIKPITLLARDSDSHRKFSKRSRSAVKLESSGVENVSSGKKDDGYALDLNKDQGVEEGTWGDGDVDMLNKLLGKHPVGKPGRWEAIAEGFKGRYRVESVIKKSKQLGEKRVSDEDSFNKFFKDRKPVDRPIENVNGNGGLKGESGVVWSAAEDLALLNALKTFPKDVAMRWDKIAVAVPGKSKAACVKRLALLKKDFRSSKTIAGEP